MNLFDAIFGSSRQSPAIFYEGRSISYPQLRDRTLKMATAIASVGTQRNDRVAILLYDSPELVEAFIAICSMGAIAVPINTALRLEDQRAIINNCRARVAIVEEDLCASLLQDPPDSLHFPSELLRVDRVPGSDHSEEVGPRTRINSLLFLQDTADINRAPEFIGGNESETAFILYTSGSTGEPKGAMHSQADIFYTNDSYCREVLRLDESDRLFSSSRLPFAYGLGNSFSFPLLNGATSVLCREKPSPEVIGRILSEARPTIFFAVPVVYNLLLEYHRDKQPLDCGSLRACISAGEALPAHLGKQWEETFGVPVLDGIGSTEMLHMFMSNHIDDVCYGSSGTMLTAYEAKLLDEHGKQVERGGEGNLWIRGASAASGYWERPDETARTFVNEWVRTGDLYRCDDSGHWFHMGRSDDCFKSSGQWVSPVEVEGLLLKHERVARAAVVEDFDEQHLPCACAFIVSQPNVDSISLENELREFAAKQLPRFKRPRRFIFVSELPYTATGKIQRFKLRQSLREKHQSAKS